MSFHVGNIEIKTSQEEYTLGAALMLCNFSFMLFALAQESHDIIIMDSIYAASPSVVFSLPLIPSCMSPLTERGLERKLFT